MRYAHRADPSDAVPASSTVGPEVDRSQCQRHQSVLFDLLACEAFSGPLIEPSATSSPRLIHDREPIENGIFSASAVDNDCSVAANNVSLRVHLNQIKLTP